MSGSIVKLTGYKILRKENGMREEKVLEEIVNLLLLLPEKYEAEEKTKILDFYYKYNLLKDIVILVQKYSKNSVSESVAHKFCYELSYCSISVKIKLIYQIYKICPEECRISFLNYMSDYKEYLDEEIVWALLKNN